MAFIDSVLSPGYFVKSIIKLLLFVALPLLIAYTTTGISFQGIFRLRRRELIIPILLGVFVYLFILVAYFVIGPYFDFSNVTMELADKYGVSKENFVPVALYISFVNSLLEEFFFRGVAFLTLKKFSSRGFAYWFSAGAFSVYHIAIMSNWFQPVLFILLILSLFIAGLIFNRLDEKHNTVYNSWFVHMCANFATNTVGFILFGII
jgi:membrane protease YdiL (CAAX protease family)